MTPKPPARTFTRSEIMRAVPRENTSAERRVRTALHLAGLRFRLHRKDLPGTPDLVLPRFRIAIFVHGCFWHRHLGCKLCTDPKTNQEFWHKKFDANVARDKRNEAALMDAGWRVIVVWECQTKDAAVLARLVSDIKRRHAD